MADMTGWDVAILLIAVYLSIVTLIRLMRRRRDELVARLQAQVAEQQSRKRAEEHRGRRQRHKDQQVATPQMPD